MKRLSLNITLAIVAAIFWTNTSSLLTASLVTPVINSIPDAQDLVPSGWRKIDAEGKLTFYLPPDMRLVGRGFENLHHEYTNGRMYLTFDYEPYGHLAYDSRAIAFGKDFQETQSQLDGKKTFLFVYQSKDRKNRRTHKAEFYVGDLPNHEVIVSMLVSSRSPQAVEIAKKIFRTIKFP